MSSVNLGIQSAELGRQGLVLVFEPDANEVTGIFVAVCGGGPGWKRVSAEPCCQKEKRREKGNAMVTYARPKTNESAKQIKEMRRTGCKTTGRETYHGTQLSC